MEDTKLLLRLKNADPAALESIIDRYGAHIQADPTGFGVHPLADGLYMLQFTFPEPQNIDEALGLRIDNVLIPIN